MDDWTFAPKINKLPHIAADSRIALAERTNTKPALQPQIDPEATYHPQINRNSQALCHEAKECLETQRQIRSRVRELWGRYAESTTMDSHNLNKVLVEVGLEPTTLLTRKFQVALGVNDTCRYIHYDAFCKVFVSVLRTAKALSSASNNVSKPKTQTTPRTGRRTTPASDANPSSDCMIEEVQEIRSCGPPSCALRKDGVGKKSQPCYEEKELELCTFAPKINSGASCIIDNQTKSTPGFSEAVLRMKHAREIAVPAFEETLRHGDASGTTNRKPTEPKPFHLKSSDRSQQREKPILFVDVDLPTGRTGRIGVHRQDSAATLARNFCASYGLDDSLRSKLTALLQEKIDATKKADQKARSLWL